MRPGEASVHHTPSRITSFIQRYHGALVSHVEAVVVAQHSPRTVQRFVESVLLEYERLSYDARHEDITDVERTFWFALYQVESLVDPCASEGLRDPYEQILVNDLEAVLPVLICKGPLPERFFATRPGECLAHLA